VLSLAYCAVQFLAFHAVPNLAYLFVSLLAYFVERYLAYSVLQIISFSCILVQEAATDPNIPNLASSAASTLPGGAPRLHQACLLAGFPQV
jgi:hypothetical protein